MRARKASKPAAADTARELRGNAKLDQPSARKLPRKKCSLQVAAYDGRLRLEAVRPRQARTNSRPARLNRGRRDPTVFAIAKALHDRRLIPCPHVVELLQRIHRDHPALSFSDFLTAIHLAYLHDRPGGNA